MHTNERWASVSKREFPGAGDHRHNVAKRHPTSLCGITALPAIIWRADTRKPKCPACVRKMEER